MKKHYKVLGLENGASKQEIQDAYDKLSIELDPKNNDNLDFFKEEFNLLQKAYEKLMGQVPESINNESSDKNTDSVENTSGAITNKIFNDGETLISLFKKYADLVSDKEKKEMVEALEEVQSHDKKYLDALHLIYKTEGVENYKQLIAKQLDKDKEALTKQKEHSNPSGVTKPPKNNTNKQSKNHDKNKNIIIGSVVVLFFLVFGVSYLIFQNKVENVKESIPIIEKKEFERNDQRKNYWKSKFDMDYSSKNNGLSGSWYDNAGTNSGGQINYEDAEIIKDTIVTFFVFSSVISYNSFKECYWECLYYHANNRANFLPGKDQLIWEKSIRRKYKISKNEFREILNIVKNFSSISKKSSLSSIGMNKGQYFSHFPRHSSPTLKDIECAECIPNFIETFSMNNLAIDEFESFLSQYLSDKKTIDVANRLAESEYKLEFNNLTSGMSYSLKNKVRLKSDTESIKNSTNVNHYFYGTDNGIGDIRYSFNKKEYATSSLDNLVNEIYKEYYSDNTLYTGATPYSYCYGNNAYCTPSYGYEECSFIDVQASYNSDVLVLIKKNNRVISHAYIKAGGNYKFKVGDGNFQCFFYYGKGWNPNKYMKTAYCGKIIGGFVNNESVSKSEVVNLYNSSMSYSLYSVANGNFIPKSSNKNEAF